jgi:hypothetical protein
VFAAGTDGRGSRFRKRLCTVERVGSKQLGSFGTDGGFEYGFYERFVRSRPYRVPFAVARAVASDVTNMAYGITCTRSATGN